MSTLIIEDIIEEGIEQEIRLELNASLRAIELNLVKWGTPTGNLIIEIRQDSNVIKTITTAFSTLNAEIADDYGYGNFRWVLDLPVKKTTAYSTYTIKLSSTVYDPNNFYAWNKDWVTDWDSLYGEQTTDGVASSDTLKPYSFRLTEYR